MTERARGLAFFVFALVLLAGASVARAEGEPTPAPLILNLLNVPMDSPEAAFRESLKTAPPARPSPEWEILPDGSARYGRVTVGVILDPCLDETSKAFIRSGRGRR